MSRTTLGRLLDLHVALAALAIAVMAAAPVVAFTDLIHPVKSTVNADPGDVDWHFTGDAGAGGGGGGG
jgi:hypothetical protein